MSDMGKWEEHTCHYKVSVVNLDHALHCREKAEVTDLYQLILNKLTAGESSGNRMYLWYIQLKQLCVHIAYAFLQFYTFIIYSNIIHTLYASIKKYILL